jgi:Kef-type K+ transport system membrane component KefB
VSREDYVAIAARLFAIFLGFKALVQIPLVAQALSQDHSVALPWLFGLVLAMALLICAFLWFFPLTVARKLLPVMKEPRSDQAMSASIGLSLGLTLIGVWFLAQGVIDSVYWLALIVRIKQDQQLGFEWIPSQIASMTVAIFQVGLGTWLVLGSAGIRRLIYKFRYGEQ